METTKHSQNRSGGLDLHSRNSSTEDAASMLQRCLVRHITVCSLTAQIAYTSQWMHHNHGEAVTYDRD